MAPSRIRQEETSFIEGTGDLGERFGQAVEHVRQRLGDAAADEFIRQVVPGESVEEEANYESPAPPSYDSEQEHVIDLGGRLRRAWKHWQFRLFVLTVAIAVSASAANARLDVLPQVFGLLSLFLFGAWSIALFRKRGLGQMFLKWLVYYGTIAIGGALADSVDADRRAAVLLGAFAVALVLTLSKFSLWLGAMIRVHIWQSGVVRAVRRCF